MCLNVIDSTCPVSVAFRYGVSDSSARMFEHVVKGVVFDNFDVKEPAGEHNVFPRLSFKKS